MNLLQQPNLKNLSSFWPNIYLTAEANREQFAELTIITSNCYRKEKAIELAFIEGANIGNIDIYSKRIYSSLPKEQFFEVLKDNLLVVIDVEKINDIIINKVIQYISQISDFKIGKRIEITNVP